ncbi:MAG: hypothetical protein KGD64_13315 [Candidatus Heimdallarchaeota archaeon]|nr:hypothetical protein [Candidatus Heimdallarchaeota archaeon]
MWNFTKNKSYNIVFFLILILTLSGTLTIVFSSPDLYIKITNVDWLPIVDSQTETYALYHTQLACEIWNPHKYNLSLVTPNTNLLDTKISFNLDDDYEIITGNIAFPFITNQTIESGVSLFQLIVNFEIHDFNSSFPPSGIYTLWVEVDSNIIPFDVNSYKTDIIFKNNKTTIINQNQPPLNWGSITWFPVSFGSVILLSLLFIEIAVAVIVFVIRKQKDTKI